MCRTNWCGRVAAVLALVLALVLASLGLAGDTEKKPAGPLRLTNKGKDIVVLSDRQEALPAFFQRQRIVVGGLLTKELNAVMELKEPRDKVFINYASYN